MSKKSNPTAIGAFVVCALVLIVLGILVFGSGRFLQESTTYVLYFDRSIGGLDIGAPVEFRGVRIGNVSDIKLVYDHKDDTIHIPVFVRLEPRRMTETNAEFAKAEGSTMNLHIERGLRAKLQSQSFVTGKLKIELVYEPDIPVRLSGIRHDVTELPTAPTAMQALTKKFGDLPIAEIVMESHRAIQSIAELVESDDFKGTVGNLNETMEDLQSLSQGLQTSVKDMADSFSTTSAAAAEALVSVRNTLDEVMDLIDDDSALTYETGEATRELTKAARRLAALADLLERHPEALLKGKPKP